MVLTQLIVALLSGSALAVPSLQTLDSDITILSDNDLQGSDGPGSAFGALYLSRKQTRKSAIKTCASLGEKLWAPGQHEQQFEILSKHLTEVEQDFAWIAAGADEAHAITNSGNIVKVENCTKLPVLCTQTAPYSTATKADNGEKWQVQVPTNNETVIGFRDRTSFRFRGVRYAPQPQRFTYSELHNGSGAVVPAIEHGPQCLQVSGGSEDCLFLNIWTPSLPSANDAQQSKKLKPVLFWIYGGGFSENSAADPNFDGGNMASRGDVVMVAVNYRVGTFGFLALQDGTTNGNFGIADQIVGLDWVKKHIQDFGGDPHHVTIVGQSSGGMSVRALMASPQAAGKFVAALPMGLPGLPFSMGSSEYYTIDEYVDLAINDILDKTDCAEASSQLTCLRGLDADTLVPFSTAATGLVVDGTYLVSRRLDLSKGAKAPYRLMTGYPRDDGAPFISYPYNLTEDDIDEWLAGQGRPSPPRSLYPLPDMKNETLAVFDVGARLNTDGGWRCFNQASMYAGLVNEVFDEVYYFEFDRTYQTPDWPKSDICEPPRSPEYPNGDPSAEYDNFHCHSGQLLFVFGNIRRFELPYRDAEGDQEFEKEILDRFASFVRGGTPNVGSKLEWEPAVAEKVQIMALDWPRSSLEGLRSIEQCEWLGMPFDQLV